MSAPPAPDSEHEEVISPFADAVATLPPQGRSQGRLMLWIVLASVFVVIGAVGGILLATHLNDPLRTLEKFPTAKYLNNFRALSGARFKGELRVEPISAGKRTWVG